MEPNDVNENNVGDSNISLEDKYNQLKEEVERLRQQLSSRAAALPLSQKETTDVRSKPRRYSHGNTSMTTNNKSNSSDSSNILPMSNRFLSVGKQLAFPLQLDYNVNIDSESESDTDDEVKEEDNLQVNNGGEKKEALPELTPAQKALKGENVIQSFKKRKFAYLRTPTHPDDNLDRKSVV